jgi:hypothetical protein
MMVRNLLFVFQQLPLHFISSTGYSLFESIAVVLGKKSMAGHRQAQFHNLIFRLAVALFPNLEVNLRFRNPI